MLKGTGGALVACRDLLPDRLVVTYGDSLLDEPLMPMWRQFTEGGDTALLAVTRQFDSRHIGNVAVESHQVVAYGRNAPDASLTWLDYGYLAMSKQALVGYAVGERLDLGRIISDLANYGQLGAYEVSSQFWEVGTPESLVRVAEHLSGSGQSEPSRRIAATASLIEFTTTSATKSLGAEPARLDGPDRSSQISAVLNPAARPAEMSVHRSPTIQLAAGAEPKCAAAASSIPGFGLRHEHRSRLSCGHTTNSSIAGIWDRMKPLIWLTTACPTDPRAMSG